MNPDPEPLGLAAKATLLHHHGTVLLSIGQTAQLSGVSEADLLGLIEYGVLMPTAPEGEPHTFDINCVMKLQRASLMRQELALDSHGFALALMFLNQITSLEAQLHSAQCDLRDCRSRPQ
jgi:chaperone modulatory protein CbpM